MTDQPPAPIRRLHIPTRVAVPVLSSIVDRSLNRQLGLLGAIAYAGKVKELLPGLLADMEAAGLGLDTTSNGEFAPK